MKRVIDTSEILGRLETRDGPCELCASADASYDESAARLEVRLDSFLRTTDIRTPEKRLSAEWLPKPETVTEGVGPGETIEVARDVFHRWVRKVRQAAPAMHNPTF
jgi:hypothetical protein